MAKTPKGYDSIEDFLLEARERWQADVDYDRENTDAARTDFEFAAGQQWDPNDINARQGRPCLTVNQIPQFIAQIVGDIRLNRPAIKVRPAEDADKDTADIREGLIRAIEHKSKAQAVYANAGTNQVTGGLGNFRVVVEDTDADVFERELCIKAIPNPFAVVWDAFLTDPTGADAGHCFIAQDMARKDFERAYPDEAPTELGTDLTSELQRSGWTGRDTVRVTEYWVMKERPAEIALLQGGKVVEVTKANEAEIAPQIATNARGEPMRRKTKRKYACMYLITGFAILEDAVEYQIPRLPIFRVPGWEMETGSKKVRWGLVRFAKDPQRLKNYWRSIAAETLALAPKQQWLVHENAEGDDESFSTAHKATSNVLHWAGNVKPERIDPAPVPVAVLQQAEQNTQDMKDVTGIHDASLGIKSNETSGKAILARQKEGDVASYIYHDNLKSAIAECGRVINDLIPQVYDTARTIRVLGEDGVQAVKRVNDPMADEHIDLGTGKFDIVVETGPSYSTRRQEAAESIMQFVQAVPGAAQVAGDLIAKAMDWPMADKLGERLKKAIPPQMLEDDEEQPTPEQQQAKARAAQQAQMQQQMQMQAGQLELAEKDAKVKLTLAQAEKLMAESGAPSGPQETDLDVALKLAGLRKAEADAEKAEVDVEKAKADTIKAQAEAERAQIAVASDQIAVRSSAMDLDHKPTEQAMAQEAHAKSLEPEPAE